MTKKILIFVTTLIFILEFSMHYYFNMRDIGKSPSESWAKEVLIDTADIQYSPKIIKYKDNYVIAYNDGKSIKIITTDNYGKKINEKILPIDKQIPYNITLLTDDNKIYLSYIKYDNTKNMETVKLDEKLNVEDKSQIKEVTDLIQIDDNAMVISYKDKIEIKNIKDNLTASISAVDSKYLMATKYKDSYVVGYCKDYGKYFYSYIKDGKASEPKAAGLLDETSAISFFSTAIAVDDKNGYILAEYRTKGEFSGARLLKFSLDTNEFEVDDFKINGDKVIISNVTPYIEDGQTKILASTNISRGKKNEYLNIAEITVNGDRNIIPVSRIHGSAIYPASAKDTVIFAKPIKEGKVELYMTSKSEEFKQKHNVLMKSEIKEALIETLEKVINSLMYVLLYGIMWFIPAVFVNALSFFLDLKRGKKITKQWFIISYVVALALKCYFINGLVYDKYKYFMPNILSLPVGIGLCIIFSIFYCAYGYLKFRKDTENNIILLDFSTALLLDTIVTLILFVPFFV